MNFSNFISKMHEQFPDIPKAQLSDISKAVIKTAEDGAIAEGYCSVGTGRFKLVERAARNYRNPRTGETVMAPARKFVAYKKKI